MIQRIHVQARYAAQFFLAAIAILAIANRSARGEEYAPGDVIEYKVGGAFPEKWERGTIIKVLPGGKQYLIHEKPSEFFPKGPESSYSPEQLRRPRPGNEAPTAPPPASPAPQSGGEPPRADTDTNAAGLLSKDDIIAYAKQIFGPGDPFRHPHRDAVLDQIRDYIKSHGTNFKVDDDFRKRMDAQGTNSVHISYAVDSNYGAAPKLQDYFGTWLLRASNRGNKSVKPKGSSHVEVTTTDLQAESGKLTINKDGTYVWELLRGDPEEKWLKGSWRAVKPDEAFAWEAGPAIWLEHAKQGSDYMVRMGREPGWPGWIDVGAGKGRTPVEYGRRP